VVRVEHPRDCAAGSRKPVQLPELSEALINHRTLYAFFLTADRSEREERAKKERGRNVSTATLDASDEIHRRPEVVEFAKKAGVSEHKIDTSQKSESEVADEIRAIVAKDNPALHWPSTH
jgi:hypothetical protein